MGGYPAYKEYKDSGVEWLGKIPKYWAIKRLKFPVVLINEKVDAEGSTLPYMGLEHIESWIGNRIEDENSSSEGTATRFLPNDVLFGKLRPYLAKVYLSQHEGLASTEALVLRSTQEIYPGYLRYYLVSKDFIDAVNASTYGAKMPRASWNFVGNLSILIPPLPEQQAIAHFLDDKTAQIDALIAKKETLLAKLTAKRTALISHAVTKGLDPTVPMKDSGIEWLGEVPAHWKVGRIKYFARCFNGSTPSTTRSEYWEDGTIPWLSSGKVNEDIVTEPSKWISQQAFKECPLQIVPKGSVIIGMVGQGKTRGLSAYLGIDTTINQNMAAIVTGSRLNGRFLHFFLQQAYEPIRESGRGANQPALDVGLVSDIQIALPPIKEQLQIVHELEQNQAQFDIMIRTTGAAIDKLKDYRTALITNAVTGKIDVRNVPIPARTPAEATHAPGN